MITLIIWILMATFCYMLAEKQGRNRGLATVLGLGLGIFAVIGYLIAGYANKCRFCHEKIRPNAVVCKHCGKQQH